MSARSDMKSPMRVPSDPQDSLASPGNASSTHVGVHTSRWQIVGVRKQDLFALQSEFHQHDNDNDNDND